MLAIARDLENLSVMPDKADPECAERAAMTDDHPQFLELARRTYANRRRRNKMFDHSLFGEPAWDMLLDLFIAAKERKRVSVTSACIGSDVPATTALRWIAVLESHGLVNRESDPSDARRAYIHLTPTGYGKMIDYFSQELRKFASNDGLAA